MSGQTRDGLTKSSTLRERMHYRRYGVWPASYLMRTAGLPRGDAEAVVGAGKWLVRRLRWARRRAR